MNFGNLFPPRSRQRHIAELTEEPDAPPNSRWVVTIEGTRLAFAQAATPAAAHREAVAEAYDIWALEADATAPARAAALRKVAERIRTSDPTAEAILARFPLRRSRE